jgi:hypothetical protein
MKEKTDAWYVYTREDDLWDIHDRVANFKFKQAEDKVKRFAHKWGQDDFPEEYSDMITHFSRMMGNCGLFDGEYNREPQAFADEFRDYVNKPDR